MSVLLFCLCGKFNCRDEYYGCHVSALFVDNVRHFWFGFHCQPFCRYHIVYLRHFFSRWPTDRQPGSQACTVRCSQYYRQLKAVECLVTCENIEIKLKLQMQKKIPVQFTEQEEFLALLCYRVVRCIIFIVCALTFRNAKCNTPKSFCV